MQEFNPILDAFDNGEGEDIVHPVTGYRDRPTEWFDRLILPDFLATVDRLDVGEAKDSLQSILLDVGCAYGYFTKLYAKYFDYTYGIDFSEKRILAAKEYNSAVHLNYFKVDLLADSIVEELGEEVDCAVSSAVFQHIAPENRYKAFRNVHDALAKDCYLILYDEDFNKRPEVWAGFYSPLSAEWISENLSDIFILQAQEYICQGVSNETIYRWELQAK